MKILVVGGGGREHALAWAFARRGHAVVAAPGNPGTARIGRNLAVKADDIAGQVRAARDERPDLVVVGPEAPLCAGLADALRAAGIPTFGPNRDGARLEGSKAWSKAFFARHGLPTARFFDATTMAEVDHALDALGAAVVKADGLAAGKGVVVARTRDEARAAAAGMIEGGAFGDAGRRVVIEERLPGREASILAISDGRSFVLLPAAEDHKAVFDGDRGPNTGGMGAVSPTPVVTPELVERARREVFEPVVRGLAAEGIDYRGVLYAGLMVAPDGTPNVLEFNCRFGDPEVEAIAVRWADDPAAWLAGAAAGRLPAGEPEFSPRAATCVVMAAEGYPGTPRGGDRIAGIAEAEALGDVVVFHAGTRAADGGLVTAGGRVLAVTALGDDAAAARARAYAAVGKISWPGAHYRTDIGGRIT
ncbi:MAG TPA: phosphoribosylamine--glycine ligase [Haliangiales bacterium]|nr:phosphoribosylamine--glycine ligase [Haliangiales bacterium]